MYAASPKCNLLDLLLFCFYDSIHLLPQCFSSSRVAVSFAVECTYAISFSWRNCKKRKKKVPISQQSFRWIEYILGEWGKNVIIYERTEYQCALSPTERGEMANERRIWSGRQMSQDGKVMNGTNWTLWNHFFFYSVRHLLWHTRKSLCVESLFATRSEKSDRYKQQSKWLRIDLDVVVY